MDDIIMNIDDVIKYPSMGNASIIAIDGVCGSGKSRLGKDIKKQLGDFLHIDLDDYIEKNKGSFKEYLRVVELKKDIFNNVSNGNKVIISGVLMSWVLKKINVVASLYIYVEPVVGSTLKRSLFERLIDDEMSVEDITSIYNNAFDKEIVKYHKEFLPYKKANIRFRYLNEN